jgi:hypothetical protein
LKNIAQTLKTIYQRYQNISLYISYLGIALTLTGIFFSRVIISSGFLLVLLNWAIEADFKNKWKVLKQNKGFLLIAFIPIIHLLGMLNTENISYGFSDIKIKLPLLLPIAFASSPKLLKAFKKDTFLSIYLLAALVSSLFGFIRFQFFSNDTSIEDLNKISLLGQNIQVSIFVCFAICITIYFLFIDKKFTRPTYKILLIFCLTWFSVYVYLLNSYTGYIVFIAILIFTLVNFISKKNLSVLFVALGLILLSGFGFVIYLNRLIVKFNNTEKIEFNRLPQKTINGNAYQHDTLSKRAENGHLIDIYICKYELKKEWKVKSKLAFENKDFKDQYLPETLIRYMSSKGLKKDSLGFSMLSKKDIAFIENGCANYLYTNKYSLESRIYHVYWQYKTYSESGNASAQSFSQRVEFLKAAKILCKENFWFGVGSGDVMESFKKELDDMGSKLDQKYYNRVHNQYIVEFIALGFWGFVAFMIIFFYPIFKYKIWKNYLLFSFYITFCLSFFTDNPLETQLGVSFLTIFYCILFFDKRFKDTINQKLK